MTETLETDVNDACDQNDDLFPAVNLHIIFDELSGHIYYFL